MSDLNFLKVFVHESCVYSTLDQARALSAREWRKTSEGLKFGPIAKGSKEDYVHANFMTVTSHSKGVVRCRYFKMELIKWPI